jgi:hypothetical protein
MRGFTALVGRQVQADESREALDIQLVAKAEGVVPW